MKLPYRFSFPARGSASRRPAVLVLALAALAALQLALPLPVPAPGSGVVSGGRTLAAIADPAPVSPLPGRALPFAPRAAAPGGASGDPLGGAVIAGTVRVGGLRYAMVQSADGTIRRVAIGGDIGGWRIVELAADHARLARGGEVITPAYGQHLATAPATAGDAAEEGTE